MMKMQILMLVTAVLAFPVMAQEANETSTPNTEKKEALKPEAMDPRGPSEEERKSFKERHLKLMEKALDEIGVTEEQRQQIMALQDEHMKKMKENWKRLNEARRELSRLQDERAGMEEIDAAIQEVTDAQSEQLKILCRNRMEMEKILGKEKNDLLMKKAREFFRKHGRRPGGGMPERPNMPPDPSDRNDDGDTPPPPTTLLDHPGMPPSPSA